MVKKTLFIAITILLAISIVYAFFKSSYRPLEQPSNGFNRKFIQQNAEQSDSLKVGNEIKEICGFSNESIYISTKNPSRIIETDWKLHNVISKELKEIKDSTLSMFFSTVIDSPFVTIYNNNLPGIYKLNLNDTSYFKEFKTLEIFTRVAAISPSTYIFKGFDKSVPKNQVLRHESFNNGRKIEIKDIIERTNDGGIASDGILAYDNKSKKIIYVYHYCNKFICLDSNMKQLYATHTIDTFSNFQIKGGSLISKGKQRFTNFGPPKFVNYAISISDNKLFIHSKIKADNESLENFNSHPIIDIYTLHSGKYEGSFYLNNSNNEKLLFFSVKGRKIIAVYKHKLVIYNINL